MLKLFDDFVVIEDWKGFKEIDWVIVENCFMEYCVKKVWVDFWECCGLLLFVGLMIVFVIYVIVYDVIF